MLNFVRVMPLPPSCPALRAIAALWVCAASAACVPPEPGRGALSAPSVDAARERAQMLLDAAVRRDLPALRTALCPALNARAHELLEPGQALAIESFVIAGVEPVWVGGEPAFYVATNLTRQGALLPRGLRVRAREGCVDQLLDSLPVGTEPPDPGEISL
jgi:hypothetical protein